MFLFPCVNYLALSSFSICSLSILQALRRFQSSLDVLCISGLFPVAACDETPGETGHQLQHKYVNGIGCSLLFGILPNA